MIVVLDLVLRCVVHKAVLTVVVILATGLLGACSTGAYFWQATKGHLEVLAASEKIDDVLTTEGVSEKRRAQLMYVQRVRKFSILSLGLPDNRSYTAFAELNRPYVVWNVVASPVDSLDLKTWCFPFVGCISYKGFYREEDAVEQGNQLRAEGLDVAVLGVPAYSTLGLTPDPVLSTFINYPPGELARLIFHELAHQVVYINDDTMFNESFATAVEELGVEVWLNLPGHEDIKREYQVFDQRRVAFRALLAKTQFDLKEIYGDGDLKGAEDPVREKQLRLQKLQVDYGLLKESWSGWSGYDRFMLEDLNNAKLAVSGLYTQHVPAFKVLFTRCGSDFPKFYAAVNTLGQQALERRGQILIELANGSSDFACH